MVLAARPFAAPPSPASEPPPAPAPAADPAAPRTAAFSPAVGTTGSSSAIAERWRRTSVSNSAQPSQRATWRRSARACSAAPRAVASCSRISTHGVSRARRQPASDSRAWKTSAFTLSRRTPRTSAISSWVWSPSSKSTSAARCSSGSCSRSASRPRSSARRSTSAARPSVAAGPSSRADLLAARAQHRQAAVAGDRVEPGLEADRPLVAAQRAIGGHEGVLEGVLGLLARAEHVPAEGEQAAVVAVEDELEGALVAGAHAGHEGVVGPPARERADAAAAGRGRERVQCCESEESVDIGPSTFLPTRASGAGWQLAEIVRARRLSCETSMPFFRHEGRRLAYTIYGEGPRTFVLVHGLLLSQKMHRPLAQRAGRARQPGRHARPARPRALRPPARHDALLDAASSASR